MKIVHITENYIEGWGYQENLLPLYQKRAGHDVVVISDNDHLKYAQSKQIEEKIRRRGNEYWQDGIKVYKIKTYLTTSSATFLCFGLYKILERERPDVIFHHNVNTSTLFVASKYKRHYTNVLLYADNHIDWINESRNRIWRKIYYDILLPLHVKWLGDDVKYYIGVSPLRCQYMSKVFKAPEEKVRFLPIGCDTDGAGLITESKEELRKQNHIDEDAFVVVSGGKIDRTKGTHILIEACERLVKLIPNLHLILFGNIKDDIMQIARQKSWIILDGWCDRPKTLSLLKMADVACWPWLHTTLIEDSVASGIPLVVKMSDNVCHFAKEQAGVFLERGDVDELEKALLTVRSNSKIYSKNAEMARQKFSYTTIVERLYEEDFY